MHPSADLRVLFRAAAGPRRGFGHLVRCRALAAALGVRPLLALRGGPRVTEVALALGCDSVVGPMRRLVARLQPDVLVVDDPVAADAGRWIAAGKRAGALVVSIHDLGLGCLEADLVVDGSVTRPARASVGETLAGPAFAVLDPSLAALRRDRTPARPGARVLVSFGGGPRVALAGAVAQAIAAAVPDARIQVAGGFHARRPHLKSPAGRRDRRIAWIGSPAGLAEALAGADVAVLGGGVSLYEACAFGVPAVGVPVVAAQEPTVAAFVAHGAALGVPRVGTAPRTVAAHAARLLDDQRLRTAVARRARRMVDGRGAARVAAAVRRLAQAR